MPCPGHRPYCQQKVAKTCGRRRSPAMTRPPCPHRSSQKAVAFKPASANPRATEATPAKYSK
eukprot:6466544-Prorocentrum_lima.AAC.1